MQGRAHYIPESVMNGVAHTRNICIIGIYNTSLH